MRRRNSINNQSPSEFKALKDICDSKQHEGFKWTAK